MGEFGRDFDPNGLAHLGRGNSEIVILGVKWPSTECYVDYFFSSKYLNLNRVESSRRLRVAGRRDLARG